MVKPNEIELSENKEYDNFPIVCILVTIQVFFIIPFGDFLVKYMIQIKKDIL